MRFLHTQIMQNYPKLLTPGVETTLMEIVYIRKYLKGLVVDRAKAELLQRKPHPFICQRTFINENVGNREN